MYHYFGKFVQPICFLLALFFFGCSNVLINEQSKGVEVQVTLPEHSGRSIETDSFTVEAWVENTQAIKLEMEQKTISTNSVILSFESIQPGTRARVVIQIHDDGEILYSGNSDYFTASKSGNLVHVQLEENLQTEGIAPQSTDETQNEGDSNHSTGDIPDETQTPSFSPSDILVTVQSKTGTANKIEKTGNTSTTSFTHQFYGIDGSQVNFSLSAEAQTAGMTLKVNSNATTSFNLKETTQTYTAKILDQSNQEVATASFTITSQMKPITVTFTELDFVSKGEATYDSVTISELQVNSNAVTLANHSISATGGNGKVTSMGMPDLTINNLSQTNSTIGITAGSVSVTTDTTKVISNHSYTVSDLYGKTSVMWGNYLRFTYSITQ